MFQRGLDLSILEMSYVSSVNWYFLIMFCLHAFFRLYFGDTSPETLESTVKQRDLDTAEGPVPVGPHKFDAHKALIAEPDNLKLVQQRNVVDEEYKRLLGKRYPKRKLLGSGNNPGDDLFGYGLALGNIKKGKRS